MAREAEFSGILNASNTVFTIAVTAAVAVGKFVVVSASSASTAALTATATDSRENTYVNDIARHVGTSGGGHQLRTKVATGKALQIGDVITVTFSGAATRAAGVAGVYGEDIASASSGASADAGATPSTILNTGNLTPGTIGDLIVGTVNLVSAGRTYTADAGWNQSTKIASTSGSGDRAVVQQWRNATAATPQAMSGVITVGGSALWSIMAESYALTVVAPGRTGRLKWNGVNKPTKYNGVEKPWKYGGVLAK